MASNYKHSGKHLPVLSASAAIVSGIPCVQEGFFGIPLTSAATGEAFQMATSGVWKIAVPASTVKGDFLYVPGANGALTEDNDVVANLTRTGNNTNSPVVKAVTDRDAAGFAEVVILPTGASKSALQV